MLLASLTMVSPAYIHSSVSDASSVCSMFHDARQSTMCTTAACVHTHNTLERWVCGRKADVLCKRRPLPGISALVWQVSRRVNAGLTWLVAVGRIQGLWYTRAQVIVCHGKAQELCRCCPVLRAPLSSSGLRDLDVLQAMPFWHVLHLYQTPTYG